VIVAVQRVRRERLRSPIQTARPGWSRRWYRTAYAIAELVMGFVYILGIPALLWWAATR